MKPTIKITRKNKEFHISTGGGVHLNDKCILDSNGVLGAYPIGSIYLSVNNTSPASLFGGTWEKIQDRFLLASGSSYSLGATGGEKTHTLTISEMPSHDHPLRNINWKETGIDNNTIPSVNMGYLGESGFIWWAATAKTGGGQPHNNMPPYLVVNVWKRIS